MPFGFLAADGSLPASGFLVSDWHADLFWGPSLSVARFAGLGLLLRPGTLSDSGILPSSWHAVSRWISKAPWRAERPWVSFLSWRAVVTRFSEVHWLAVGHWVSNGSLARCACLVCWFRMARYSMMGVLHFEARYLRLVFL